MKKPTIAIDIDDVLADYAAGFIEFSNVHWGTNLTVDDYDEHWANVWKVDVEEVIQRAETMHEKNMVRSLARKPDAHPVLERLSHRFNLMVVTSRRIQNKEDTLAWLRLHYPMLLLNDVTFSGFFDTVTDDSINRTKGDIIALAGADYMIDDQVKHCLSAAERGIEALLFGDYKWNQLAELPSRVTRVVDWESVERYFDGR